MIRCEDVRPDMVAYLDSELEPTLSQHIQAHLVGCKDCRDELSALQTALGEVQNLPTAEPSAGFHRRFWEAFQQRQQSPKARFFRWLNPPRLLWGSSVAAAASLALVYLLIGLPKPQNLSPEDLLIAHNLELFADYEAIEHLDLLADMDAIEALQNAD